ncbi:MAG TPA: zinc ribbon domain-containing protein [Spirochaetota bacterium]|nr:zinc ribbon domain-containing protein [Spirochaetota bacterium]HPS85461.1 zinc ribbon domain-containing protein [Spirochaetota bacterium]
MAFKIITGSAMIITGLVSELMGLLFIIASSGMSSRLVAAGIFFTSGLPLLIFGFKMFRGGMVLRPELVRKGILKAAAAHNGEISKEAVTEAAGWDDIVIYEINDMIKKRIAKAEERDGRTFYIFPEYQIKYVINKCPFCGNDYPVRDDVQKCPSCGGDLKFLQIKSSTAGNNFSMGS